MIVHQSWMESTGLRKGVSHGMSAIDLRNWIPRLHMAPGRENRAGRTTITYTRKQVRDGWNAASDLLRADTQSSLAALARLFAAGLAPPPELTERFSPLYRRRQLNR